MDPEQTDQEEKGVGRAEPCSSMGRSCGEQEAQGAAGGLSGWGQRIQVSLGAQGEACDNPAGQRKPSRNSKELKKCSNKAELSVVHSGEEQLPSDRHREGSV